MKLTLCLYVIGVAVLVTMVTAEEKKLISVTDPFVEEMAKFAALEMKGGARMVEITEAYIQQVPGGTKYYITMDVSLWDSNARNECKVEAVSTPTDHHWVSWTSGC